MKRDTLVLWLAVTMSAALMGWIVWSARPVPEAESSSTSFSEPPQEPVSTPSLDPDRVAALEAAIEENSEDEASLTALANVYFRAHRFEEAIPWFERTLEVNPDDVESSTNLGVSYLYAGSVERAIEQLNRSLELRPDHAQTWLSIGIVRAFGLDDLDGAIEAWERVIEVAPGSREAKAAHEALTRVPQELSVTP